MVTICEVKHKHPLVCVSLQSYIPVQELGCPSHMSHVLSPAAISAQQQDLALASENLGIRESESPLSWKRSSRL